MAAITAFAIAYGGMEGAKNLWNHEEGRFILENMGVIVWPGRTRVVRIFGVLYLQIRKSRFQP